MNPIQHSERNKLIDIIRGFALLGVLIANFQSFNFYVLPERLSHGVSFLPGDRITNMFIGLFVDSKFITLFSLLFGYGFGVIIERVHARGAGVNAFFIRRMLILLLIGIAHISLWFGEILSTYAVCGMLLLLFRRAGNRTLLISACVLLFVAAPIFEGIKLLLLQPDKAAQQALFESYVQAAWSGDLLNIAAHNYRLFNTIFMKNLVQYKDMAEVLGGFLIGYYFLRINITARLAADAKRLKKVQMFLLPIALLYLAETAVLPNILSQLDNKLWQAILNPFENAGIFSLALLYAVTIARWYYNGRLQSLLNAFADVGRLSLTNYLMHTLFFVIFFYGFGFGFLGRLHVQWTVPFCIIIYALQVVLSRLWLKKMRYGPVEWLWRQASYGKYLPLKR